jgi:hypothetical protein
MQRMLRKELQPPRLASLPSSTDRSAAKGAFLLTGALIGIMPWCEASMAAVCHVPAAVLCQGCVERLSIRVTPGGVCQISFASPASPASQDVGKFVDINIEAGSPRPVRRRASTPNLSDAKPAPLRRPAACFVFNGRNFCE